MASAIPPSMPRARAGPGRFAGLEGASADVVPYDHAARFRLEGKPGRVIEDTIVVGPEGIFVAVAIGYGLEEDRGRGLVLTPRSQTPPPPAPPDPPAGTFRIGDLVLGDIPVLGLIEGFRVRPDRESLAFDVGGQAESVPEPRFNEAPVPAALVSQALERVKPPDEVSFLFSLVDTASGRELQDEPTHNLASLGKSNGERPFRSLAPPLAFRPRSTLRLQVIERSEGVRGTLFIVLYGYKVLGTSACPPPLLRAMARPGMAMPRPAAAGRMIPFDYVARFSLLGQPGRLVEDEITINAEGGFVATSVGYGLAVPDTQVPVAAPRNAPVDLDRLKLRSLPTSALRDGVRVRPSFRRVALDVGGALASGLDPALLDHVFERLNRPDDVSFRYSIFEGGRGRELQNQPIHNVAGLGIANGDRPFKRLVRPLLLQPRSTVRIAVEERYGRGLLFIVLQGYKRIGGGVR